MSASSSSSSSSTSTISYSTSITIPIDDLCCPITFDPMKDPVITQCGHTFERTSLEEYMTKKNICPICRTVLNKDVYPNIAVKSLIDGQTLNTAKYCLVCAKMITKQNTTSISCHRCANALYCSKLCRDDDKQRHMIYCIDFKKEYFELIRCIGGDSCMCPEQKAIFSTVEQINFELDVILNTYAPCVYHNSLIHLANSKSIKRWHVDFESVPDKSVLLSIISLVEKNSSIKIISFMNCVFDKNTLSTLFHIISYFNNTLGAIAFHQCKFASSSPLACFEKFKKTMKRQFNVVVSSHDISPKIIKRISQIQDSYAQIHFTNKSLSNIDISNFDPSNMPNFF